MKTKEQTAEMLYLAAELQWVRDYSVMLRLRDDTQIRVRTITDSDKAGVEQLFSHLSHDSLFMRFLSDRRLTAKDLAYLTQIDLENRVCVIAEIFADENIEPIGLGEIVRDKERPHTAELALAVADAYQQKGVGTCLLNSLIAIARRVHLDELHALALSDNWKLHCFLKHIDLPLLVQNDTEGTMTLSLDLAAPSAVLGVT